MAITNMNELFDKLQQYIDKKITYIENNLEELFEEYGLKEILANLDNIEMVAVNIDAVNTVAIGMNDVITVSRNMDDIEKVPGLLEEITEQVDEAEVWHDLTRAERQIAHRWAQEELNIPVDDGTHTGYSSYHWSKIAESNVYQLQLIGDWNPNDDAYPTPTAHGDYWIVSEYDNSFDNQEWLAGDVLIWQDNVDGQGWIHKKESVHWLQIVGKPSLYTPKPHYHSEYVQVDNLISYSTGEASAGYPIKLWLDGTIHNSMIKLPITYIVGWWTPVFGNEYPDLTDHEVGASWLVNGVQDYNGYTFLTGDLIGRVVCNGDVMVWSKEGWIIKYDKLLPETYLKRTGEYPMWGNLNMGMNKIEYVMDGVDNTDVATVGQLGSRLDEVFSKSDHISISSGATDSGKPIILNEHGLVDQTMIAFNALIVVGEWNPSGTEGEYPTMPDIIPGYSWRVTGVGDEDDGNGYEFLTGDLVGKTTSDGDWIIYTQSGWILVPVKFDVDEYYKIDGSNPLTADFHAGGHRISRIADAINVDDATSYKQVTEWLNEKADTYHLHTPQNISPQGAGSGLDADLLDGYNSTDFAMINHQHNPGDIQPQGVDSGLDADMVDGKHASEFRLIGDNIDWTEIDNKPTEYQPIKASMYDVGGIRIWADGDILHIANDNYVAP